MNITFTQNNESDNEISRIEEESQIPSSPESPPVIPVPAKRARIRGSISQQRGIRQHGGHGVGRAVPVHGEGGNIAAGSNDEQNGQDPSVVRQQRGGPVARHRQRGGQVMRQHGGQ